MAQCVVGPLSRCGLSLGLLCALPPAWVGATEPVPRGPASSSFDAVQDFDISAQPLATALDSYAGVTHVSIAVPSEMVHDRMSSAIHGRLSADAALRQLLDGTGLTAERQTGATGSFYVLAQDAAPAPAPGGLAALSSQPAYAGGIQTGIWNALCADARTVPGSYRLVFRFRLDAAGRLTDPHLYASTGDTGRDAAVLDALRRVRVSPPPAVLARRAMLMTMLPDEHTTSADRCAPGAS